MSAAPLPTSRASAWQDFATSLAPALRATWRGGYGWRDLRADLLAGCVVGCVALPLSMALAIATGVRPQHGLYTAMTAGFIIALLGGSRVQVSGPTAAFVVILAPIAARYGLSGLAVASLMAGGILIFMGAARLGRLIQFVPYPVTTGFTVGIAIVIATLQLRDFFGLEVAEMPEHYIERVAALYGALPTCHLPDLAVGAFTLALLIFAPRVFKRVPPALIALPAGALLAWLLVMWHPSFAAQTIQTRFGGVPQMLPLPGWPWNLTDELHGPMPLTFTMLRELLPAAFAIAALGAIESLLSAVVAAGMSGTEHHPDGELLAQGVGNVVAPFFGGFAATGAIARTAANVRSGGRSPIAAAFHAVFLIGAVLLAAPLLGYLPMASMAALLLLVAWNMSDIRHAVHMLRVAPRGDVLVLILCVVLTVVFDMTVAVGVGIVLAALLFIGRMAELTGARLVSETHGIAGAPLPANVLVYEVAGPLFFGAAERAMALIQRVDQRISVVLLDLRHVPTIDATGLVALESALARLHQAQIYTVIAGIQDQPLALLARAGWKHREWLCIYRHFEHGVELARNLANLMPTTTGDAHKAAHA